MIATTLEEAQALATVLLEDPPLIVGCDMETTVDRKEDPGLTSVIQISTPQGTHLYQVYRIWKQSGSFPSQLSKVLGSDQVIKVGVGLAMDMERLYTSYGMKVRGWIDLQHVAVSMKIPTTSLSDLATKYISTYAGKDPSGHKGNWDTDLDERQIRYAVSDAEASLELYYQMVLREPVPGVKRVQFIDEGPLLLHWIKGMLRDATTNRSVTSLINQIVNSYGPWRNKYIQSDRKEKATHLVETLIKDGHLPYDELKREIIVKVVKGEKEEDESKTELVTDHDIQAIMTKFPVSTMKSKSVLNVLCNSYGPWSLVSNKLERASLAVKILQDRGILGV